MFSIKSTLVAASAVLATAGTASAQGLFEPAEGGFYVSGFVGGVFPGDIGDVDLDSDVFFGGALGGRLPFRSFGFLQTRLEVEVSYFETGFDVDAIAPLPGDDLDLDTLFITANSYADLIWAENQPLIPYIGGGLGAAVTDVADFGSSTDVTSFSAIGVTLPINKLEVYGEGRYYQIFTEGPNPDGFTLSAGLRLVF